MGCGRWWSVYVGELPTCFAAESRYVEAPSMQAAIEQHRQFLTSAGYGFNDKHQVVSPKGEVLGRIIGVDASVEEAVGQRDEHFEWRPLATVHFSDSENRFSYAYTFEPAVLAEALGRDGAQDPATVTEWLEREFVPHCVVPSVSSHGRVPWGFHVRRSSEPGSLKIETVVAGLAAPCALGAEPYMTSYLGDPRRLAIAVELGAYNPDAHWPLDHPLMSTTVAAHMSGRA